MTTDSTNLQGDVIRIGTFTVPRRPALYAGGVAALFLAFNYRGIGLLAERWNSDSNYGHGYLIPLIALYFLWTMKDDLAGLALQPSLWGIPIFAAGLIPWFLALPLNSAVIAGWAIVIMATGLVIQLCGLRVYRATWMVVTYLAFMIPLPQSFYNSLANPLQQFASWASANILESVFQVYVMRRGNVIELAGHTLQVAEACSGMRSIMGLLALGVAFAWFWDRSRWERVFLIASTIPIAIIANVCRVTGTGLMYHLGYARFAQGFYHEFTGWFVFIFAMALFLTEAWLMDKLFVHDRPASAGASAQAAADKPAADPPKEGAR